MTDKKLDHRHLETVQRILEAIATVEHNPARALVALEDAGVALMLGLQFGLETPRIAKGSDELMAELVTPQTRVQ